MAEFRKNKKITNFLYTKPVLAVLAIVIVFFAISIFDIAKKSIDTKRNRDIAFARITELQEKERHLQADIAKLETESGREDIIREKFRAVKEGEGLIVITDDLSAQPVPAPAEEKGFWNFLKNLFK